MLLLVINIVNNFIRYYPVRSEKAHVYLKTWISGQYYERVPPEMNQGTELSFRKTAESSI